MERPRLCRFLGVGGEDLQEVSGGARLVGGGEGGPLVGFQKLKPGLDMANAAKLALPPMAAQTKAPVSRLSTRQAPHSAAI